MPVHANYLAHSRGTVLTDRSTWLFALGERIRVPIAAYTLAAKRVIDGFEVVYRVGHP